MPKRRATLSQAPVVPPQRRKRRQHLTVEEWRALLQVARDGEGCTATRNEALLLVMYECGLRRQEPGVMRLAYANQLHESRLYAHRGKGSESGYVDISKTTAWTLNNWIDELYPDREDRLPESFIFPGRSGSGISGRQVYNIIRGLAEAARLPADLVNPHMLKHSRVQHLLDSAREHNTPAEHIIKTVAQIVGHRAALTTIQHYNAISSGEVQFVRGITDKLVR